MNRTELELRLSNLEKQRELTAKAIDDTLKQIDDLDAEENFKKTQKVLKKFLKFKGKIVVCQYATWGCYIFKCKDIVPQKSKYRTPELNFIAEGNIYRYEGTNAREYFETLKSNVFSVGVTSDTYEKFREIKDWNFWEKRPVLKLIKAVQGVNELIIESGIDTNIEYDDKPAIKS